MNDSSHNETTPLREAGKALGASSARWTLEDSDRDALIQALLHPPEPNARMRDAVKRYKAALGEE